LVSNDGKTGIIADFGLAKYNEHVTKTAHHGQTMTRGIGTAKFMAPEIADGDYSSSITPPHSSTLTSTTLNSHSPSHSPPLSPQLHSPPSGDYSATIDVWAFGMVMLICTGVTVPKPLSTQAEVDALVAKIPGPYTDGIKQCIRAALTVKADGCVRPSALDLLQMAFFAPYYNALPEAMFQNAIRLANRGPWAALANVQGLKFDATSNDLVQISRCRKQDGTWNSTAAAEAVEKHRLMVSSIPGNESFAEDYDLEELAIAKSQLRSVQLVNKLQVSRLQV
jgi:hypothetical protein